MLRAFSAALWLNAVMLLLGLSILAVPTMAPRIAAQTGVSTQWLGGYSALMWSASILTSVGSGALIARFGALRVSQLCLLTACCGLVAGAFGTLPALALTALLIGLAQGAETPASSVLLVQLAPPARRTLVISIKQTGGQIGAMLSGLVFPALSDALGWQGALLALAPVALGMACALESPRRRAVAPGASSAPVQRLSFFQAVRLIAHHPRLASLAVACLLFVAVQVCQQAFLVSYLVAECGVQLTMAGALLSLAQLGGLLGRISWGALVGRRLSAIAALVSSGVGMALCAAALGTYGARLEGTALAGLCFLFGLTSAGWVGVHIAETARLVPLEAVGQATGAMLTLGVAGLIAGPIAFAALSAASSFGEAYLATALLALVGVFSLALPRRDQR